ncbi:MAG: hypothetical protein WC455_09210 [Dehalococcoidia bacterium]
MNRWIIAICPMCGRVVDVTKLMLWSALECDFMRVKLVQWVSEGLTIEIRNEGHFPVSLNPCDCVRDFQAEQRDASIMSLLDEAGVMNTDLLDDTVHDVASHMASNVNNSSSSSQVRFITQQTGDSGTIDIVKAVLGHLGKEQVVKVE